jgi:hypothetical protein
MERSLAAPLHLFQAGEGLLELEVCNVLRTVDQL